MMYTFKPYWSAVPKHVLPRASRLSIVSAMEFRVALSVRGVMGTTILTRVLNIGQIVHNK